MVQKFGVGDIRGTVALTPTPALPNTSLFDGVNTVDLAESDRMIRALIADGIDGIATNGTLGEMATLTPGEWQSFATTVYDAVAETAPDMPLFIGATGSNTRDTIERIEFLDKLGVPGVLLGRPMWSALGQDNMIAYYRDIAAAFPNTAIMLYDNAEAFKGPIPTETYRELAKIPQIVAAKYTAMGPKFDADMKAVDGKVRILPLEIDWLAAHVLFPHEALGCWSSSALCGPEPVIALRDAIQNGNLNLARRLTHRINWTYEPFLARTNFPEFSKYNITLEKLRFDQAGYVKAGPARPPYQQAPEAYEEGARENGRRWRNLVDECAQYVGTGSVS